MVRIVLPIAQMQSKSSSTNENSHQNAIQRSSDEEDKAQHDLKYCDGHHVIFSESMILLSPHVARQKLQIFSFAEGLFIRATQVTLYKAWLPIT